LMQAIVVIGVVLADLLYTGVDPRIRHRYRLQVAVRN